MDDHNTMVYNWHYSTTEEPLNDEDRLERRSGNGPVHVDQATFRSKANRQNNYLLDRQVLADLRSPPLLPLSIPIAGRHQPDLRQFGVCLGMDDGERAQADDRSRIRLLHCRNCNR
jgi:hypothetical protein